MRVIRLAVLVALFAATARADSLGTHQPPTLHAVSYTAHIVPAPPTLPWYADLWKEGIGAFLGAFFAFLFIKIAEYTRDLFERQRRDLRALNRVQHILNDYLSILNDDIYVVGRLKAQVDAGLVQWSYPRPLPIDKSLYEDVLSLDVVNKLRSLYDTARKINNDIENAIAGYEDMRKIYLESVGADKPAMDFYRRNAGEMVKAFEVGARFQKDFMETDVPELLALARVLSLKGMGIGVKLLMLGLKSPSASKEEVAAERERLAKEIREVKAASRAKIEQVFGSDHSSTTPS